VSTAGNATSLITDHFKIKWPFIDGGMIARYLIDASAAIRHYPIELMVLKDIRLPGDRDHPITHRIQEPPQTRCVDSTEVNRQKIARPI